jgi:hypothetical protein
MWVSFAGCRTSFASLLTVAIAVRVPSGNWKILLDLRPVGMRGAVRVLTLEVAALSVTMEGMEPFRTPFLINFSRAVISLMLLAYSCSSTRQGGGAMSDKIE